MSITLNSALISNLNQLKCLPLPVSKLIIDQTVKSLLNSSDGLSYKTLNRIISIECIQPCNWIRAVSSLKFLFKHAIKNEYPAKAIAVFLAEKTVLSDIAEYASQKYSELVSGTIGAPKLAKLQEISWSVCNLKQSRSKQQVNKMYVKLYTRTVENQQQQEKVVSCLLPEFQLLLSQVSEITANIK